jgi:hypothetical protein
MSEGMSATVNSRGVNDSTRTADACSVSEAASESELTPLPHALRQRTHSASTGIDGFTGPPFDICRMATAIIALG